MLSETFVNVVIKLQDLRREAMKREVVRVVKDWDEINTHSLIYNYFKSSLRNALIDVNNDEHDVNIYLQCIANNILSEQNYNTLKIYPNDIELALCVDNFSSRGKKVIELYCNAILDDDFTSKTKSNIVAAKLYARKFFAALFFNWVDDANNYAKQIKKFNKAMKCFNMNILDNVTCEGIIIDFKIRDMENLMDVIIFVKYLNQIIQY